MINVQVKRSQMILASLIGVGVCVVVGVCFYYLGKEVGDPAQSQVFKKIPIETATGKLDPHEIWRFKLEGAMEENKQKVDLLEKMVQETLKSFPVVSSEISETISRDLNDQDVISQGFPPQESIPQNEVLQDGVSRGSVSQDIDELRQELIALKEQLNAKGKSEFPSYQTGAVEDPIDGSAGNKGIVIQKIILNLKDGKGSRLKKTTDNTIPAGAFAKATLLGGVDASTSIQASSDPRPVLLRLRHEGTLPRKLKSDLKNCHVLASAYGDLSSERVYMRLEKLTCTEPATHEISEMVVSGYVAGEDGKAGLRGIVVDKTGPLLRNSFMGGFLGGMGQFLTQARQPVSYPLGAAAFGTSSFAQVNPLTNEQMLKSGVGHGVSHALEKYADFYIKRAEQLQPVLQVAAGREVDVVFTESAEIGETLFKSTIAKHNDQRRRKTAAQVSDGDLSRSDASQSRSMKDVVAHHEGEFGDVSLNDSQNNAPTNEMWRQGN